MPLANSLKQELSDYKSGRYCVAVKFLKNSELSKEDIEAYKAILNNKDPHSADFLPANRLAILVRNEGYRISASSIDRHRAQDCPCYRMVG